MKIGDRNGVQDSRLGATPAVDLRRPEAAGDPTGEDGRDQLEVSDYARALNRLVGTARTTPAAEADRAATIAALRAAVERGTYRPDIEETARKLLLDEFA